MFLTGTNAKYLARKECCIWFLLRSNGERERERDDQTLFLFGAISVSSVVDHYAECFDVNTCAQFLFMA